jgi:TolB-like protein/ketosteroid isomerase-like protein
VPGEAYVRRLAVVLIAILQPEEGDDASALAPASEALVDALRAGGGDAEPLAPDRVVAAFDTPAQAIGVALRAHRSIAAAIDPSAVVVRVGLHATDAVASAAGLALGEAIAAATGLAVRAPAGGVCASLPVAQAVERMPEIIVRDLGSPPAGEPHAYLVLARESREPWPRRRIVEGIVALLLLGGTAWLVLSRRRGPATTVATGVTLGVMPFKGGAGDALRGVLRDGLNTQLSFLGSVKVYSREFLDFLVTREGLSEYEAASRLGIRKVLGGHVTTAGPVVRVEVQIVDIATGTLDSSFVVVGRDDALIELESDVANAVIGRLGIELSSADARHLESFRATDVDTYRRFLATEGETARALPAAPGSPEGPTSWLPPRAAWAGEDAGRDEVLAFLERLRTAIEERDLDTLATLYVEFPAEQRAALARYFADARDLRVKLADVDVAVSGDEAIVSYTRTDDFVDVPTGRSMHVSGRVTKLLRRAAGRWQLAPGR